MSIKLFESDSLDRWIIIAVVAAISFMGLYRLQFSTDPQILIVPESIAAIYILGLALNWIGVKTKSILFMGSADFFCSAGQLLAFVFFAGGLQFIAYATNFPLIDGVFSQADAYLGFDWSSYSAWIDRHAVIKTILWCAYSSWLPQIVVLGTIHCIRTGSDDNAEFIWCFIVGMLIVILVAIPFPALGYPGKIGQHHIDVLLAARGGVVKEVDGIITFPSFHAVLGLLLIYFSRSLKPLLVIIVPLNVLLILATPPMGGHYLVDVMAGFVVAGVTIKLVRWFRLSRLAQFEPSRNVSINQFY